MIGAIIHLIILVLFLLFAFFLSKGKGAFLLAGYNTLTDTEKAQYNEVALCKFMSKIMYGISFSLLLFALSEFFKNQLLLVIGLTLFISLLVFALVYSNTGNRFKRKSNS